MRNRPSVLRMLPVLIAGQLIFSLHLAGTSFGQSATPTSTPTIDPTQLQGTLWNLLQESDWGGLNSDEPVPANQWTFFAEAGGDNPVGVTGNYGFLLLGTMVVTNGGSQGGTIRWRVYPNGWNPNVQPWFASSPPITVPAGDTVSIPIVGSFPLTNIAANTGVAFNIDAYPTVPMTIDGGGQGYNGQGGSGSGNPCTVFIGILWPYHEH